MPTKPVRGNRGSNRKHLPTEATRGLVKGALHAVLRKRVFAVFLGA